MAIKQFVIGWRAKLGIALGYKTVHQLVHYRLQSSLKVPRPVSVEHQLSNEKHKKT